MADKRIGYGRDGFVASTSKIPHGSQMVVSGTSYLGTGVTTPVGRGTFASFSGRELKPNSDSLDSSQMAQYSISPSRNPSLITTSEATLLSQRETKTAGKTVSISASQQPNNVKTTSVAISPEKAVYALQEHYLSLHYLHNGCVTPLFVNELYSKQVFTHSEFQKLSAIASDSEKMARMLDLVSEKARGGDVRAYITLKNHLGTLPPYKTHKAALEEKEQEFDIIESQRPRGSVNSTVGSVTEQHISSLPSVGVSPSPSLHQPTESYNTLANSPVVGASLYESFGEISLDQKLVQTSNKSDGTKVDSISWESWLKQSVSGQDIRRIAPLFSEEGWQLICITYEMPADKYSHLQGEEAALEILRVCKNNTDPALQELMQSRSSFLQTLKDKIDNNYGTELNQRVAKKFEEMWSKGPVTSEPSQPSAASSTTVAAVPVPKNKMLPSDISDIPMRRERQVVQENETILVDSFGVLETIKVSKLLKCSICYGALQEGQSLVLPCTHLYCNLCMQNLLAIKAVDKVCSICRAPLDIETLTRKLAT